MESTTSTIAPETIPLTVDTDGVICVGNTRVTLDTMIAAFLEGAAPEEIVHQYPSLDLADVYTVITYYLQRQAEVDAYLQARQEQVKRVREENEHLFDPSGIRDRLLTQRAKTEQIG